ncbi:ABC transporter ATP-binding protein [Methyloligella sp. 2.7D]|uniref:ABC transporter ATP-binding protein n=1 Tax=unclassified Methyloligella TaxID=2625955 RepID=UPI001FEEF9D4|nr:ABC transporter ATP-binding protein [Methyloligella sp. GL2]
MDSSSIGIETIGIGKDFGAFRALDDVSFRIDRGAFLTLLGPSGSGKTTLLMILAGFEQASRGTLRIDGEDKTGVPAEHRGFGVVFQGYALFPHMTAEENIAFPLKVQNRPAAEIKRRVGDMIDLVGLAGHSHKKPSGLSGGQQQRVALARALVYEPPVLLLDEPFSALDKNLRSQMQEELRRIHRDPHVHGDLGTTFIFVTHDQEEALALSTDVAIFNQGKLQQIGSPSDVYERPANRFVAEFLGEINIFPALCSAKTAEIEGHAIRLAQAAPAGAEHLAVRPENMDLVKDGKAEGNTLPVTVTDRIYLGASTRLLLATDSGTPAILEVPTSGLADTVAPGSQVWLGWDPSDSLIF